jgi:diguanylate cyclase (GGDEF)-like protein/PAS domain S-box-containing protein
MEDSENRYQLLIDHASEMFWVLDLDEERFLFVSPAVMQTRGFTPEEMRGQKLLEVMSRESEAYIQGVLPKRLQCFQHGILETYSDELQIIRKDGSLVWMEVSSRIVQNQDTGHFEAYGVARDISERLQVEQQVRQLSQAVQQSPASIIITDRNGDIIYVNPKFTEITGYTYEEVLGENTRLLKTELTPEEVFPEMWEAISSGREWRGEFCNRKKNGEQYWELASISPIFDRAGQITHYVAVKEDITERKRKDLALQAAYVQVNRQLEQIQMLQVALREQAIRDPLTGLYNRRYLYETLGQEFSRSRRENRSVSMIMLDIDHFKCLNDQYGHAAGDAILQALSDTLLVATRKGDTVCRYGGEEILIAMPNTTVTQARRRASKLMNEIAALSVAFEDKWLSITVSIGVAAFPEHGEAIDEVIRAADNALYRSKETGRNRLTVYAL